MESSTTGKSELDGRSPLPILQPHGGERSHHQYQEQEESKGLRSRSPESMLRLLPMVLCIIALVLMLKSSQDSLSYSNLAAFRYLVHANGICAGYSLLAAIISGMPRPFTMSQAWTFFLLDQVLTYLILGAGAVATQVLFLAEKGDIAITWSAACISYPGFCHKATASVAITFLAVVCYALISLISSYRLFSRFDPPLAYTTTADKSVEIAAATTHG